MHLQGRKAVRRTLAKVDALKLLWNHCTIYHCELRNLIVHPHFKSPGQMPYEIVTGRTPDISEYLDYHWYQTMWYLDQETQFPDDWRKPGKWIRVAHCVGQGLCYYNLPLIAKPIIRSTVQALTNFSDPPHELQDKDIID
jgi:hypothetical protein